MVKIRILIADGHPVIREGLVEVLSRQKDMSVIGEAGNGEEVCQLYDKLLPDVLLLDLQMPKEDGLQVVTELMSRRAFIFSSVLRTHNMSRNSIVFWAASFSRLSTTNLLVRLTI